MYLQLPLPLIPKKYKMPSPILTAADNSVSTERQETYGHPYDNFEIIAKLWTTFKGIRFTEEDVSMMMILTKVARLKNTPKHIDSLIDIVGYVKCSELIMQRKSELGIG